MKKLAMLFAAVSTMAVAVVGLASCGDDDDSGGNGGTGAAATTTITGDRLTTEEQQQIQQTVDDYLLALRDQDMDQVKQMLRDGTGDAQVTRELDRARDKLYTLVAVREMDRDGDKVEVKLTLRDRDGNEVEREMTLERDQDQWRVVETDFDE